MPCGRWITDGSVRSDPFCSHQRRRCRQLGSSLIFLAEHRAHGWPRFAISRASQSTRTRSYDEVIRGWRCPCCSLIKISGSHGRIIGETAAFTKQWRFGICSLWYSTCSTHPSFNLWFNWTVFVDVCFLRCWISSQIILTIKILKHFWKGSYNPEILGLNVFTFVLKATMLICIWISKLPLCEPKTCGALDIPHLPRHSMLLSANQPSLTRTLFTGNTVSFG